MKKANGILIEELETIANSLNIDVVYEAIKTIHPRNSALFKIRGKYKLIIDKKTKTNLRLLIFLETLAQFDLENIFITPQIRDLLKTKRESLIKRGKWKLNE
jgi:50S ribosomal subunit-associated GTPase HflX